jgi:hypothetical protein
MLKLEEENTSLTIVIENINTNIFFATNIDLIGKVPWSSGDCRGLTV